jgi:hypothetical protein
MPNCSTLEKGLLGFLGENEDKHKRHCLLLILNVVGKVCLVMLFKQKIFAKKKTFSNHFKRCFQILAYKKSRSTATPLPLITSVLQKKRILFKKTNLDLGTESLKRELTWLTFQREYRYKILKYQRWTWVWSPTNFAGKSTNRSIRREGT